MKKKVPVVTVAEPEEASQLAGIPLEATVALADLARAVKDGLLGFCADVGLMVMRQVMDDELARRIGPSTPGSGDGRLTGTAPRPAASCSGAAC